MYTRSKLILYNKLTVSLVIADRLELVGLRLYAKQTCGRLA